MTQGRTLMLAVDGLDDLDLAAISDGALRRPGSPLGVLLAGADRLRIRPGGPSEPAPALVSVLTGASVGHTGVATELALRPEEPAGAGVWYASRRISSSPLATSR